VNRPSVVHEHMMQQPIKVNCKLGGDVCSNRRLDGGSAFKLGVTGPSKPPAGVGREAQSKNVWLGNGGLPGLRARAVGSFLFAEDLRANFTRRACNCKLGSLGGGLNLTLQDFHARSNFAITSFARANDPMAPNPVSPPPGQAQSRPKAFPGCDLHEFNINIYIYIYIWKSHFP
jgi:hypothetical protein